MYPNMMSYDMGFMHEGVVIWLLLIIIVAILIYFIITGNRGRTLLDRRNESAMDILKKRYAKGKLSQSEYNKIKEELSK